MTNLEEFKIGEEIITDFCNLNCIVIPNIIQTEFICTLGHYSFNHPDSIFINIIDNDKIAYHEQMSFNNHPAMIYETTIIGTMLHEFGHYLNYTKFIKLINKFNEIENEPIIHYNERKLEEDIAESIRLFIINPARLASGRPERYKILFKYLKHRPYQYYDSIENIEPVYLSELYNNEREKLNINDWNAFKN